MDLSPSLFAHCREDSMNLPDLFAIPRQRQPQKIAIQYSSAAGEEIRLSYDELHAAAEQLAAPDIAKPRRLCSRQQDAEPAH